MTLEASDFVCDIVRPDALRDEDKTVWQEICAQHPAYGTPLLQPCFAVVAARTRDDVRLALYRHKGKLVGVFGFLLRPNRFARPVGVPFADVSGPVLAKGSGLTPELILQLAGVQTFKFENLVDPWGVFSKLNLREAPAHQIDLQGTNPDDYLEACRSAYPKRFKNFRRQMNQLERQGIALELTGGPPTDADFEILSGWKSTQFRRTGRIDLMAKPLTADLLETAKAYNSSDARGYIVRLSGNGKLLAAHFGLRSETQFHPWLAGYRPDFALHSPGSLILYQIIHKMPEMGLQVYELAGGHEHYKKYFARSHQMTFSGKMRRTSQGLLQMTDRGQVAHEDGSMVARLGRRLDHIAVCETRPLVRALDLAKALASAPLSRSNPHEQ